MPCPPPTHMVIRPVDLSWKSSELSIVFCSRAPVIPNGWPTAIAPPLTLSRSMSTPRSWYDGTTCAANASLISTRSMSPMLIPAWARARLEASTAMHPSRPDVLFMQKHWDVMRSDNGGDMWHEISGNLPSDFGFPIQRHAHEPDTVYVVPIKSDSEHYPPDGKLRVYRSRTGGNEWEALTEGLPQSDCYVNILRSAMAVDSLDSCGIYFGTTGGQVYASNNSGDTWAPIVRDLPAVMSVEVQTLP